MPWSIDGPSTDELGYLPHHKRGEADDGAPRDGASHRDETSRRDEAARDGRIEEKNARSGRLKKWLSVGIVVAVVALISVFGTAVWMQVDRNALADDVEGNWAQSGSVGSVLVITDYPFGVEEPAAGELFYKGTVDGEKVHGVIDIPSFPSMSTTLQLNLLGRRWEVQIESQHVMTLTDPSGRVMTFRKV